jgi:hypothetical protein
MRNGAARSVLHPPLPGPQGGREQTNFAAGPDPTSQASDLILDYAPRRQFVRFHQRKERFACIVTHRRAGKTVACIQDLQRGATSCENLRPRFAYLAPFLKQSKAVAWDYLRAAMAPLRPYASIIRKEARCGSTAPTIPTPCAASI